MKKILIIEDEPDILDNTIELLTMENFEVVTASDGMSGYEQAVKQLPDMILCDIRMPQMDGYQVLEKLQEDSTTSGIPFVFISSNANADDIQRVRTMGIAYLVKPFEIVLLLDTIMSHLNSGD